MTVTRAGQAGAAEGLSFDRLWPYLHQLGWKSVVGAFDEQLFVPPARPGRRGGYSPGGLTMAGVLEFISENEELQKQLAVAQSVWSEWEDPTELLKQATVKPATSKPAVPLAALAGSPARRGVQVLRDKSPAAEPGLRACANGSGRSADPAVPPTAASPNAASRCAVRDSSASDVEKTLSSPGSDQRKRSRNVDPSGDATIFSSSSSSSNTNDHHDISVGGLGEGCGGGDRSKVPRAAEPRRARLEPALDCKQWSARLERIVTTLGGWCVLEGREVLEGSNSLPALKGKRRGAPPGGAEVAGGQVRAQDGRATPALVAFCIEFAKIGSSDVFMDIGSGIGSVVLQVAAMTGCKAEGIELLEPRHRAALRLKEAHDKEQPTNTQFHHGDFSQPEFKDSITRSTVLFINNARSTFAERCVEAGAMTLDSHVARLCRLMKDGTRVITLDRLGDLETAEMKDVVFKVETKTSPEKPASWTESKIDVHLYTKHCDHWICSLCTTKNPLTGDDDMPLVVCGTCVEDPNGMQRAHYPQRERKARAMRDATPAFSSV
jgi:hypothetical protein